MNTKLLTNASVYLLSSQALKAYNTCCRRSMITYLSVTRRNADGRIVYRSLLTNDRLTLRPLAVALADDILLEGITK